jgi:hypothetical protein
MPMPREDHESLLAELLSPDLEQSRRTEILQLLRTDYSTVLTDFDTITQKSTKLQSDNDDLIISNSKLFRQLGIVGANDETKKKEEKKTFSESITLETLEK